MQGLKKKKRKRKIEKQKGKEFNTHTVQSSPQHIETIDTRLYAEEMSEIKYNNSP